MMNRVAWILALTLVANAARAADKPVTLALERVTTLHVGKTAVLQIPADRRYSRFRPGKETSGEKLVVIRRSSRSVVYRAVRAGRDVIVISPDVPEGECISCATLHYFIDVVPEK